LVLGEALSKWTREWHFPGADSPQHPSFSTACGPWHDGEGYFLTLYICNDCWLLLDPLRDLPHLPSGMRSNLQKVISESFRARTLPIPNLPLYKQRPRIAVYRDAPRPTWSCVTFTMCTILHLLLGVRHLHELPGKHIIRTHMLALHRAILEWLILGTLPAMWIMDCLHQDITPPH